jgi:hypothetical protein
MASEDIVFLLLHYQRTTHGQWRVTVLARAATATELRPQMGVHYLGPGMFRVHQLGAGRTLQLPYTFLCESVLEMCVHH